MKHLTPENIKDEPFKNLRQFWRNLTGQYLRSRADVEDVIIENALSYPDELPGFQPKPTHIRGRRHSVDLKDLEQSMTKVGIPSQIVHPYLYKEQDTYGGLLCVSRINENNQVECGSNQDRWFKSLLDLVPSQLYIDGGEYKMIGECRITIVNFEKKGLLKSIVRPSGDSDWYIEDWGTKDGQNAQHLLTRARINDLVSNLRNKTMGLSVYQVMVNIHSLRNIRPATISTTDINLFAGKTRMFPGMNWGVCSDMIYLNLPITRPKRKLSFSEDSSKKLKHNNMSQG